MHLGRFATFRSTNVRIGRLGLVVVLASCLSSATLSAAPPIQVTEVNRLLTQENKARQPKAAGFVDDLAYLRRVTVDLVGRIPTDEEIQDYQKLAANQRRAKTVERLLADPRFADRWTVFFADMLRIRSNADGGAALLAYVHKVVEDGMPYDECAGS